MKTLPRLLLCSSIIFLFSCTITKRRYLNGYFIGFHKKPPTLIKSTHTISKGSLNEPEIIDYREKELIEKNTQNIFYTEKTKLKSFIEAKTEVLNNHQNNTFNLNINKTTIGSSADKTSYDISKKYKKKSILYFFIGILTGIFFGIAIYTFPGGLGFFFLLVAPLIFLFVSMINSFKAMKDGKNRGLLVIAVFDILLSLTLLILLIALVLL